MAFEKVDIVIVGAGASGSVYASVLAKAGKKVVLLDSGPDWELSDLISSEIWGRRANRQARRSCSKARIRWDMPRKRGGASAVRRCIISPISRGCCRPISG
jgi:choline dehydrogenase-like flavoprotein